MADQRSTPTFKRVLTLNETKVVQSTDVLPRVPFRLSTATGQRPCPKN